MDKIERIKYNNTYIPSVILSKESSIDSQIRNCCITWIETLYTDSEKKNQQITNIIHNDIPIYVFIDENGNITDDIGNYVFPIISPTNNYNNFTKLEQFNEKGILKCYHILDDCNGTSQTLENQPYMFRDINNSVLSYKRELLINDIAAIYIQNFNPFLQTLFLNGDGNGITFSGLKSPISFLSNKNADSTTSDYLKHIKFNNSMIKYIDDPSNMIDITKTAVNINETEANAIKIIKYYLTTSIAGEIAQTEVYANNSLPWKSLKECLTTNEVNGMVYTKCYAPVFNDIENNNVFLRLPDYRIIYKESDSSYKLYSKPNGNSIVILEGVYSSLMTLEIKSGYGYKLTSNNESKYLCNSNSALKSKFLGYWKDATNFRIVINYIDQSNMSRVLSATIPINSSLDRPIFQLSNDIISPKNVFKKYQYNNRIIFRFFSSSTSLFLNQSRQY